MGIYDYPEGKCLDMAAENELVFVEIDPYPDGMVLKPGRIYIGSTVEEIGSDDYIPLIEGKSSVGRLGISVHSTAGVGDLGFRGRITLEISSIEPVRIYPGVRFCQALFLPAYGVVAELYEGRYQSQARPTPSRMWRDFVE